MPLRPIYLGTGREDEVRELIADPHFALGLFPESRDWFMCSPMGRGCVAGIMRRADAPRALLGGQRPGECTVVQALVRRMGAAYPDSAARRLIEETLRLEKRVSSSAGIVACGCGCEVGGLPEDCGFARRCGGSSCYDRSGFRGSLTAGRFARKGRAWRTAGI